MATCRWVVNSALRKIGRLAGGREPRPADTTDAFASLQGLYGAWIGAGAFGRLNEIVALADVTAGENQRIMRDKTVVTVTLPELVPAWPEPLPYGALWPAVTGSVDQGNRPPRDMTLIQLHDTNGGQTENYVYDATRRAWIDLSGLQLDDRAPLSEADPEGLAASLATEIADTFGAEMGPTTLNQARRFTTALTHKFSSPRTASVGSYW